MKKHKIRDENGNDRTDTMQTQKILRTKFRNLSSTKLESLKGMDGFLGIYDLPILIQNKVNNLNWPITSSELKAVIKIFHNLKKNRPGT